MQLVDFSLRRRVTVAMCAVAIVIFGLVAFNRLRVSLLPELSYPTLTIETRLPGAAPAEIEQLVTRPVEERVGVVSGAQRLTSISRPGLSQVTVEFGWGRDMDFAAIDVRQKLDLIRFPDGTEAPVLLRFDPDAEPILRLYLSGASDDLYALRHAAEEIVEKELESAEGVAAVEVHGGLEDEIEIEVDEQRLALTGLSIAEVGEILAKSNVDQAGGSLYEREARYLVRTRNQLASLDEIRDLVLTNREGRRVRLRDVAEVRRTHRERETITRLGAAEAVELAIHKEGDANTTAVASAIHERLEHVRSRLPKGMHLTVATDQSSFIRSAVDEVLQSAIWGGAFAVLVLLLFLRNLRSTLVIAASIPISVVATFFLMYQTGTTLNVMSLGGLALGVGMLVDNAIVVLEAIERLRERGGSRIEAARVGAGEVGRAVMASTLTTVAVFVPVVFLDGVAAQLFRDTALTVCFSLLVSLAVSLTLIPMMAALGDSGAAVTEPPGRFTRAIAWPLRLIRWLLASITAGMTVLLRPFAATFDAAFGRLTSTYPDVLSQALRRPGTSLGVAALAFGAALMTVPRLGTDLIPSLSQGEFAFVVELPQGTPLPVTDAAIQSVGAALNDDTAVEHWTSIAGRGAASNRTEAAEGEHSGLLTVRMAPDATPGDEARVIDLLRGRLAGVDGARARLQRSTMFSLRRPVEIEIYGQDIDALRDFGAELRDRLAEVDGVLAARSSAEFGHPEILVHFDREALLQRGLDVADVAATVRHKLQGEVSTKFEEDDHEIDMRLRAVDRRNASPEDVRNLIVGKVGAAIIRLDAVADVVIATGPSEIHRIGQERAAIVSADVSGRSMDATAEDIRAVLASIEAPEGITPRIAGQEQEMSRSLRALLMALALAGFLVYLVMASQFESFVHPFVVIFTLPLAAIGVVAALFVTGSSISVVSMIGVVMLAGIVVNNAIVLVDAINTRREAGMDRATAIVEAGRTRLRPILMTSMTTVLGLLPMALATGAGAELRRALAVAVIGGLSVATVLTLLVIPVVYVLLDRKRFTHSPGPTS